MIKISILYPNKPDARFDLDYYTQKHMPLSIKLLSAHPEFRGVSVEHGLSGAVPGADATYIAMCHFLFESVRDFVDAFTPNAAVLQSDIQNYTDIEPVVQISEVLIETGSRA